MYLIVKGNGMSVFDFVIALHALVGDLTFAKLCRMAKDGTMGFHKDQHHWGSDLTHG